MADNLISFSDDVSKLKGVGSKKKEQLARAGIETVQDLLDYYPVRYRDKRRVIRAMDAGADKDSLVMGRLIKTQLRPLSGRRSMLECTLRDESCVFYAVFFNMPYLKKSLIVGDEYLLFGKMRPRNAARVWTNPEMSKEGSERDVRGIIPVYRHSAGLTDITLRKLAACALDAVDASDDWLGADYISERKLCDIDFAYRNIHFPESEQRYKAARYRLIYDKLLMYQLAVRESRLRLDESGYDSSIPPGNVDDFISGLPFELTDGQKKCIDEIMDDLSSARAMNRLIQGDVGCGKTAIAEAAIFRCASAGYQSAMMVPTEILARQHYERLNKDFSDHGIKCALLISGMKASEKRLVIDGVASGDIDVLIGTHAIIQKDVLFNNLALAVTDEQHRFGVAQRRSLVDKGRAVNVCVMSATPIPRTLAATVFGDMDFSIIRSRPGGRKKTITRALDPNTRDRAYIAVENELQKGNRAYIIAPSIDSDDDDMLSVEKLFSEIKNRYPAYKAALLHGRLTGDEKSAIMKDFADGKVQILVSTIVIEVGIDVPEATVIVIENSERFGLSQMHQLRGRVGRSDLQSYCFVINYSKNETAIARAKTMAEISDGFEISEADYQQRGPGDVMGTMQSGTAVSDVLSLSGYTDILEAAIRDSESILSDPAFLGCDIEFARERMQHIGSSDNSNII